eukprot:609835_1
MNIDKILSKCIIQITNGRERKYVEPYGYHVRNVLRTRNNKTFLLINFSMSTQDSTEFQEVIFTYKATTITIGIITCFYAFVCTPLCVYFSYHLWKLNSANVLFFTKRHTKVVLLNVLTMNIYVLIIRTITDFIKLNERHGGYQVIRHIFVQSLQFPIVLICVRLWLLYYDYSSSVHTMDKTWKIQITHDQSHSPWTSNHRWLGNPKIVITIAAIYATIIVAIIVSLPKYVSYTQSLPIIYLLFIIIMMVKIRKCRDQFYIRNEFYMVMMFFICSFIVYVFIAIFVPSFSTLRLIVLSLYVGLSFYFVCGISTWWMLRQYQKQSQYHKAGTSHMNLGALLSKQDGFDLFAYHLVREFSIENLSFLLEIMQIKQQMIGYGLISEDNGGLMIKMPSARIKKVRRKNSVMLDMDDLKRNIEYILNQYVVYTAEHQINLSSKTQSEIMIKWKELNQNKAADAYDAEELMYKDTKGTFREVNQISANELELAIKYIKIFDEAMSEIYALIETDPLRRFFHTEEGAAFIADD